MSHRAAPLDDIEIPRPDWRERREKVRRTDDRTLIQKCRTLANDLSKLLGLVVILLSALAGVLGFLGVHVTGPQKTIDAIAVRQDSLSQRQGSFDQRLGRLESGAIVTQQQLGDLTSDVRFLSYLSCVKDAGNDPRAAAGCRDIIRAVRGAPGGQP